ncbi:MAG: radical SAM protein, partial [Myxococcota bacterium]
MPDDFNYLGHGDIVRLQPGRKEIRVLFRHGSRHNSFLTTEQCNNYCLMCSQPPKDVDDAWLADEIADAIPLIDPETPSFGITGGEPTLLGDRFLRILRRSKSYLPRTSVHVLSNGRRFSDPAFARAYADIGHPDLMVGIPIYSDHSTRHDYVVQAAGAFDETILGILNLKRMKQKVEVRVVLHKQTFWSCPDYVDTFALSGTSL